MNKEASNLILSEASYIYMCITNNLRGNLIRIHHHQSQWALHTAHKISRNPIISHLLS